MTAEKEQPKRRKTPWFLGLFVLISFAFLFLLQTSNLWKDFSVETASDTLLLYALSSLNFFAFIIFGFIFLRSVLKLLRERRALQLGARLKTRLFGYFFAISLLPIIAMAGFSYLFMNRAIERWFSQIPENVLTNARDKAVAEHLERLQLRARSLASALGNRELSNEDLAEIAEASGLIYIEIISPANEVAVQARMPLGDEQSAELDALLARARSGLLPSLYVNEQGGQDMAEAEFSGGRKLRIVPAAISGERAGQSFQDSLAEFDLMKERQTTVRQLGFLTLGVLTFLLIFASSWTAIYVARGLTAPITALAEGADEIATGNLAHRVDAIADDELALLVGAFNEMSARLEANSAEIKERRRYIETVLVSLPTGVISFDAEHRITTINPAAVKILDLEDGDFTGLSLANIVNAENRAIIERLISRAARIGNASEQTALHRESVNGGSSLEADIPVALTARALANESGAVLVIEDLSDLIAAQRASAWQEVARRMAHEIKNPLTPIQLSAERIAKRFKAADGNGISGVHMSVAPVPTDERTAKIISEGTQTILREVHSLKAMVDEFSRFARLPNAKLEPHDLSEFIRTVIVLYEDRLDEVKIEATLADGLPAAMIDTEQLKRVFVNLIDNAIEAFDPSQAEKIIWVSSRYDAARDILVAEVSDNGKGIDPGELPKLFQPYFSTKGRGTGLGLAIVQRIISEHSGKIKAVANQPKGAKFIIELPVT
ncbi:ATP-binding protein [soil metagenome]